MSVLFADVDDLRARWPDMPVGSDDHAQVLLADASQFVLDECPSAGSAPELTLKRVVCAIVRRAMSGGDLMGMDSWSQGAGPFQETFKPRNPDGDLYLTKQEKRALGCNKQRAFSVDLLAGYDAG